MNQSRTFLELLGSSFRSTFGHGMTLLGTVATIALGIWHPISGWIISLCAVIWFLGMAIFVFAHAAWKAWSYLGPPIAKVRDVFTSPLYGSDFLVLVLDPSSGLNQDAIATIYERRPNTEEPIGFGRVIEFQTDGCPQLLVDATILDDGKRDLLKNAKSTELASLFVKAHLSNVLFQRLGIRGAINAQAG